jgi:hypothetical protein
MTGLCVARLLPLRRAGKAQSALDLGRAISQPALRELDCSADYPAENI